MSDLGRVINAELFKVWKKKRLYFFAGLWWLGFPLIVLIVVFFVNLNTSESFLNADGTVNAALQAIASPLGLANLNLLAGSNMMPNFSLFLMLIVALSALILGEDRRYNMWKTVLSTQPNRFTVLTGKILAALITLGVIVFGAYISSIILGSLGTLFLPTKMALSTAYLTTLGYYAEQWLFGLTGILFAFLVFWFIRNQVLSALTIFFLPPFIEGLYFIYRSLVGFDPINPASVAIETRQLQRVFEELPNYFLTNSLYTPSRQIIQPLLQTFNNAEDLTESFSSLFLNSMATSVPTIIVYGVIFSVLLYISFSRRDI